MADAPLPPGDAVPATRHVLHVAAECAPLAKAGGLGDVVGALPAALARAGHWQASVLLPRYGHVPLAEAEEVLRAGVSFGGTTHEYRIVRDRSGSAAVATFLVEHELYRPPGVYVNEETGRPFERELERNALLCHAATALVAASRDGRLRDVPRVDVVHAHDHHAALTVTWLRELSEGPRVPCVLTVHNGLYSGPHDWSAVLGLGLLPAWRGDFDHGGRFNALKAGLLCADRVTTVSPTHARELTERPEMTQGLDYAFRMIGDRLVGILNGIDAEAWDPARDPNLPTPYDASRLDGKAVGKAAFCDEHGLDGARPLLAFVGRLVPEKGVPLVLDAIPQLFHDAPDAQVFALGSGAGAVQDRLLATAREWPARLRVVLRFDDALSHRVQGATDALLMPSLTEPCGLTQLYALRYGSVPVVNPVGGLRDTVVPFDVATGRGNGAWMARPDAPALAEAVAGTLAWWRDPPTWRILQRNGMSADYSWARSAELYRVLYDGMLETT